MEGNRTMTAFQLGVQAAGDDRVTRSRTRNPYKRYSQASSYRMWEAGYKGGAELASRKARMRYE